MTHIRKLASALCLVLLCLSYSNAQTIDATTGNLVTNQWSGTTSINGAGGLSGGYTPGYVSSTGTIVFGYTTKTVSQVQAVNQALTAAGTGIQINGLNYSWQYYNEGMNRGSLTGQINVGNASGQVIQSYTYSMPKNVDGTGWVSQSGSETFTSPYTSSQVGYLGVAFTGKDDRYWAGYYGPMVRGVDVRLRYGVDPCETNPAYSPSCAGFNNVVTSGNIAPNPYGYAYGGDTVNNSFAINTALAYAGSGAMIHGFQWGYVANANGPYCAFSFLGCWDQRTPWAKIDVNITNSSGASLYSYSREYQNSYNTVTASYLFPTSQQLSTLGNFYFTGSTNDQAYVGSMWTRAVYTVDPCVNNPLYSPTCKGYATAYAKNLLLGSTVSAASAPTAPAPAPVPQAAPAPAGAPPDPAQAAAPAGQTQQQAQQGPPPQQGPGPAPDPNQNPVAQMDPAQPSPQQPGPAPTQPQPAGGPPQVAQQSAPPPSSGGPAQSGGPAKNNDGPKMTTTQALSIIKNVQEKDKATQQMALQNAAKVVEGSTQQSQATATAAIASLNDMSSASATAAAQFSSQTTQSSLQVATQVNQTQQSQQNTQTGTQSNQLKQTTQSSTQQTQLSSGTGLTPNINTFGFNTSSFSMNVNTQSQVQSVAMYQPRIQLRQAEVEVPIQVSSFNGIGRAGNPLSEMMMQQRFEMMQSNIEQRGPSVNKNVQPNDLAGGVDVASMAVQPKGFELYSFMIKDSTFYPPKEVYRNQKVVDNAMVLRQMSSDRLHQEMVDSQYKEK